MFPLAILPLPGELVPLHIFEPRYQQLLQDAETNDIRFGIYFTHVINTARVGSLMRLESVIKRYPDGRSDIVLKCEDIFSMTLLLRTYKSKMYPGGEVNGWHVNQKAAPGPALVSLFTQYLNLRNFRTPSPSLTLFEIAHELNLPVTDRYKLLQQKQDEKKELFLAAQLRYQIHLLNQEERSKDVFHLN